MKVKKILSGDRSLTKELYIEDTLYFDKQKLHFFKTRDMSLSLAKLCRWDS